MSVDIAAAKKAFEDRFGKAPELVARAPGRVNIIGEHTDYNHGFVLPMAIERETLIVAAKRDDLMANAYAANFERSVEVNLEDAVRNADEPWIDYVVGVAHELNKLGKPLHGADLLIMGDVPLASGLSSSASLEMAALVMFEAMGGFKLEGPEAPQLGKRVENDFLGLSSGIMDQFISRLGRKDHALFLDCRSLEFDLVPVAFPEACFVIANTGVSRGLTASKYNERVSECNQAMEGMAAKLGKAGTHLRDFTIEDLEACKSGLSDVVYRRARHVITEDGRTKEACEAMRQGALEKLGQLMDASDESLIHDYEVSCDELAAMTEVARSLEGCYGARMTGAGFGGCTVNLVEKAKAAAFSEALMKQYQERIGLEGEVIASSPAEGAGLAE